MNHTAFFASLKAGDIADMYLLEGEEEYIKQQALARLCEKLLPKGLEQMNLTDLVNPEADELIASAETLPFMGDKRVVVVRDLDLLTSGRKAENEDKAVAIQEYLEHASPSSCLVFYVKGKADKRKKLYTALKKKNALVEFQPMNDQECASWVQRSLRVMGKQASAKVADQMVFTVGRNAALLRQEMEKLASYLGERTEVEMADIDAVCTKSLECTVFQMVDAQVAGKMEQAFRLLAEMEQKGEDRIGILAMLLRQYRILYHMRCLLEEKTPQAAQAGLLGIPPFAVSRTQQQAKGYPKERLRSAYDALLNMEQGIKTGRLPQDGCVQTALFTLGGILGQ